jgi:alanyl-tRNA synthetase
MAQAAGGAATRRLYRDDSYLKSFRARVLAAATAGEDLMEVELDRTAFYPTGGGQPHDTGRLGDRTVVEVKESDDGRILHVVKSPEAPAGEVEVAIDWARRFDHMQQHSGQHILSRAFIQVAGAATRSFHLGAAACTIDIDLADPQPEIMRRAERLANEVVFGDAPVTVRGVPADELPTLPRAADQARELGVRPGEPIRLVQIGTFDENPCGGTHVARAGEVGCVAVRSWERFKTGTRVTFLCGGRVVREVERLGAIADACGAGLSVPLEEIPAALLRMQEQTAAARREIRGLSETLAAAEAAALEAGARSLGSCRVAVALLEGRNAEGAQRVAQKFAAAAGRVALLATSAEGTASLVFARAREGVPAAIDMGRLMTRVCAAHQGRGGGRPELARGGGFAAALAARALEQAFHLLEDPTA